MAQVADKLVEAQQAVRRAEANVQRARDAAVTLKKIRAEGSKLKKQYANLEQQARAAIKAASVAQRDVMQIWDALVSHRANRPEDLPSDEELAAWEEQLVALEKQQVEILEQAKAAKGLAESLRFQVVLANQDLQKLRFHERTLVRVADGEDPNDPAWARGGIATLG